MGKETHDEPLRTSAWEATWWGGQFERMIGLVKSALNKTIGNGVLRWNEQQEVLLDMEITLNNWP